MIRKAKAVWRGTGRAGNGHLSTDSGVLADTPYSFKTRFENEKGTNPEELIAAAHAGCFTMSLAFVLQGAGFTLRATAPTLVWLAASNYLIRVFSLGFLSAVTEARSMRYIVDRLSCDGAITWSQIGQNPDALLKRGEGLAEAFDVDAF